MGPNETGIGRSWTERRRLMRFRRQKEHLRFSEEIKLVPRGLVLFMLALLAIGDGLAMWMCAHDIPEPWPIAQDLGAKAATLVIGGAGLGIWIVLASIAFAAAYVFVDARRRGMNAAMWLFIVLITLPAWVFVGFILYFVSREPLPYHCPKCGTMVNARFNYCPACQYVLHRTCLHCQREVGEMDRYCPHCGNDLEAVPVPAPAAERA